MKDKNMMNINWNLDPSKVHEHDMISIQMLQICGPSTWNPLEFFFEWCSKKGSFRQSEKKQTLFLFIRKTISNLSITIAQSLCFQLVTRFLNAFYIRACSNFLWKQFNLQKSIWRPGDSCKTNCCQSLVTFINVLIRA